MRVKVRVKKGESQSIIPGIFVMLAFLSVSTGIFLAAIIDFLKNKDIMAVLEQYMVMSAFAMVFFAFGCYFLYFFLKKPRLYQGILTKKTTEYYQGKQIYYMVFEVLPDDKKVQTIASRYGCYTYADNNFQTGEIYTLHIKEFNWRIKAVTEPENTKGSKAVSLRMSNVTMKPVFWSIEFILGVIFVGGLISFIYGLMNNKADYVSLFVTIFLGIMLAKCFGLQKQWDKDNSLNKERAETGIGLNKGISSLPIMSDYSRFYVTRQKLELVYEVFYIEDVDGTRLFKVSAEAFERRYKIVDSNNIQIGVIKSNPMGDRSYTVCLDNEPEFNVRPTVTIKNGYEVTGLDFLIEGDINGLINVITTLSGEPVAVIGGKNQNSGWQLLGDSQTTVNDAYENNIYIMFLALCVTIGNMEREKMD